MLPSNARVYQIAGTQHGGQPGLTTDAGACVNPRNPHSPAPALRALVVALERWVSEGILPPPSRVPRVRDGTLVEAGKVVFPEIPGFAVARIANEVAPFGDWLAPKPEHQHAYRTLVPRVDADDNEIAGIRLPDIAVPLATYTGWNFYKSPFPEGKLCDRDGSYSPFLKTRVEREQRNDPRRSISERYTSQEAYVERVREAAFTLARDGFLLPVDAAGYVLAAKTPALRELFAH